MEDLPEGANPPETWAAYKEAILRPRRWIDGLGIMAACEVCGIKVAILQQCRRTKQWMPTCFFIPQGAKAKASAA
eukprot:3029792-Alexandrium_andersonii.AAC.1